MPRERGRKRKSTDSVVALKNEEAESEASERKKRSFNESTSDKSGKRTYTKKIKTVKPQEQPVAFTADSPSRNKQGKLVFADWPDFRPSLTPKEVLQAGSFGGTYFRPIKSSITGKSYDSQVWRELPEDWLKGLNISKQVASPTYDINVNKYRVKCGGSLQMWEESGWIHAQDPYGWFQWYCRFYQGRRTPDDERQIGRWLRCAGPKGRWRNNLISKCVKSSSKYDNQSVSPVVRQTLQHWAYVLSEADYNTYAKTLQRKGI